MSLLNTVVLYAAAVQAEGPLNEWRDNANGITHPDWIRGCPGKINTKARPRRLIKNNPLPCPLFSFRVKKTKTKTKQNTKTQDLGLPHILPHSLSAIIPNYLVWGRSHIHTHLEAN